MSCSGSIRRALADRDGRLHKGRTGAARLALEVGASVYPVGIVGTDKIQPPDARAPKLTGTCSITIGRPIDPQRYTAMPERHRALRAMTDEVMFEIRELTGQEYVDRYAGKADDAGAERHEPARPTHVTDSVPDTVPRSAGSWRAWRASEPHNPQGRRSGLFVDSLAMDAPITITLPDGSEREYAAGTTAGDVATSIGKRLAKAAVAATVDGAEYDLERPLPDHATVAIVTEGTEEGATSCATRRRT